MRDNIIHHQMHTLDSPSVITFSTERPRMLAAWSFIAQNAPTESCRCTTRIPWYHQNPAYTHRILFALTACFWSVGYLLCWFIVMISDLVCNDMYWYERHCGSFYRNPTTLKTVSIASQWVNWHRLVEKLFFNEIRDTTKGNISSTNVTLLM